MNENRSRQFQTLKLIQSTSLEEDTKVLKNRTELTSGNLNAFESIDRIGRSKNSSRRISSNFGGFRVVLRAKELSELVEIEIVGTGEISARSESNGEIGILESFENVGNDGIVVDGDGEDLSFSIDTDNTVRRFVLAGDKHRFSTDSIHIDACAGFEVVEMDKSVLGDEIDDAISFGDLHRDGEIVGRLRGEKDIDGFLGVDGETFLMINLDDVELSRMVRERSSENSEATHLRTGRGSNGKGE